MQPLGHFNVKMPVYSDLAILTPNEKAFWHDKIPQARTEVDAHALFDIDHSKIDADDDRG